MDGQSKNNTWVWVVIAIIAVAALLVAYYYYSYTPMPSDATGEAVTEEKIAADLEAENFDDLGSELKDIDKEIGQ